MMTPETVEELFAYAASWQPKEMCGLLFYRGLPFPERNFFRGCYNVHADAEHGFEISHTEYMDAVRLEGQPWATVHSHPLGPAKISGRDMQLLDALALVENPMKMVIVGLKPLQIRIYAKVEGQYKVEWAWDMQPFQVQGVLCATNS